jgi:GxxExxY protein
MHAVHDEPPPHLDRIAHAVIGAAIEVHRHLGAGHLEVVYERALLIELELRGIRARRQVALNVLYKGVIVAESQIDLLVEDVLVVELKSVERLAEVHRAQVLSYLKMGGFQLGLLINFNEALLRNGVRRVILTSP